jgi:hypothetical protein
LKDYQNRIKTSFESNQQPEEAAEFFDLSDQVIENLIEEAQNSIGLGNYANT